MNIWISAIPLTVCSSSAAIARSAFITRRTAAWTRLPANFSVIKASGVSTKRGDRHLPGDRQQVADRDDQHHGVDQWRQQAVGQKPLHTSGFGRDTLNQLAGARPDEEVQRQRLDVVVDPLPDVRTRSTRSTFAPTQALTKYIS